jgi:hypothetical protein
MISQRYKSFVGAGKGLGLAKKLRKLYEVAGFDPMPIDEFKAAIRAGRHPTGTLAFSVVDNRGGRPRFPGTVIVEPDGSVLFAGSTKQDEEELRAVLAI